MVIKLCNSRSRCKFVAIYLPEAACCKQISVAIYIYIHTHTNDPKRPRPVNMPALLFLYN